MALKKGVIKIYLLMMFLIFDKEANYPVKKKNVKQKRKWVQNLSNKKIR